MNDPTGACLSVIIPACNEEGSVAAVVRGVQEATASLPLETEILLVDDGSSDATAQRAREAGALVLETGNRGGYGAALKRGLRAAHGDYLAVVDGDGTYPVHELPRLVRPLMEGAEHVVGARTGHDVAVPAARRVVKWFVRRLAQLLTGRSIPDLNSGFRCFTRAGILEYLPFLPDGFSFTTSITVATLLDRRQVAWVAVDYYPRTGSSKFRPVKDTLHLLTALLRSLVYFSPFRVFGGLAALCGVAALSTGIWDVFVEENLADKTVLLTLAALQLFALGLIADLVVRRRR